MTIPGSRTWIICCAWPANLLELHAVRRPWDPPSCTHRISDMQITPRLPVMVGIVLLAALHEAQAANSTRDLLNDCQSLERGKQGSGRLIDIPRTREALVCWGYMKAMQDLSVWVDQNGNRILGSCPAETVTTLDLIRAFLKYGRSYRGELPDNPALAIAMAFQQAFPCDEAGAR
jgi:hypothetical protein